MPCHLTLAARKSSDNIERCGRASLHRQLLCHENDQVGVHGQWRRKPKWAPGQHDLRAPMGVADMQS